jgi:uncharacterized protein YciI
MKNQLLAFVLSLMAVCFIGKKASAQTAAAEDEYAMKSYYMVFLTAGSNRSQDSITAAKLQKGHLENITRLFNEKKLVLAGPFLDKGPYKGIFLLDVATPAEAIELLETDPAIKAGRLSYELHPWYGPATIRVLKKSETK